MRFTFAAAIAAALSSSACQTPSLPATTDIYSGFTLLDPASERRLEDAWMAVDKGKILRIGSGRPPQAADPAQRHDLRGKFVLPGFIDAHAHITHTGMQAFEQKDGVLTVTMESDDRITQHNARIALARGVTTIRNPGGDPVANARYDRMIASGQWIGPEARHAGAVIEPPPFSGSAFAYPRNDAEWDAEARRQAELGMTYFKLYVDLSEDELAAGIRAAKTHELIPIAHLNKVSWRRAIDLGVEQLEHALPTSPDLLSPEALKTYSAGLGPDSKFMYRWFELVDYDSAQIRELVQTLADRRIPVNLTLIVNELIYNIDRIEAVLPSMEIKDMNPTVLKAYLPHLKASATGWTPEDFDRARAVMPKVIAFAKLLHDADVPMMIGTDAGGGTFYYRELALHRQAGIPAWDVLRMATNEAATVLKMEDRIGKIATGYEADLVILEADPLADMSAAAKVFGVVNNGALLLSDNLRRKGVE
jgi:imidazolonepropionase-like amidohydrolase